MSIEQEIKELSGQIENLTKLLNSVILTNTNNNSNMSDANFKINQGEVFISPANISGQISCSRESLGKELQKAVIETINQQAPFKGSPLWNAINGDKAGNWESKSDPHLMEVSKGNEVSGIDYKGKNYSSGMGKITSVDFQIVDGKGQMICRMERPSDHELSEEIKKLKAYDVDAQLRFIAALMPTELLKLI